MGVMMSSPKGPRGYVATLDDVIASLDKIRGHLHNIKVLQTSEKPQNNEEKSHKIITLEVGHGPHPDGFEPGAVDPRTGKEEWKLNQICAASCKKYLQKEGYEDVEVTDENNYLGSIGRNNQKSDIFISIHHNAFNLDKAQGAETIIHEVVSNQWDHALAEYCSKSFSEDLGITNRGVKRMSLSVLEGAISDRWTPKQGVCLIEPYFITGRDVDDHEEWSRKAGTALGKAIISYLNYIKSLEK